MDARHRTGADRKTAEERREAVLRAAMGEFATKGLHGASTERVAREAGIAHSYVFKLFGTKRDLFLAATEVVYDRILNLLREGAKAHPEDPIWGMGNSFRELLERREELLVVIQSFAASGDPGIEKFVRGRYVDLYRYAREASGATPEEMRIFWAHGMMLVVAAAINLPALEGTEEWVHGLLNVR